MNLCLKLCLKDRTGARQVKPGLAVARSSREGVARARRGMAAIRARARRVKPAPGEASDSSKPGRGSSERTQSEWKAWPQPWRSSAEARARQRQANFDHFMAFFGFRSLNILSLGCVLCQYVVYFSVIGSFVCVCGCPRIRASQCSFLSLSHNPMKIRARAVDALKSTLQTVQRGSFYKKKCILGRDQHTISHALSDSSDIKKRAQNENQRQPVKSKRIIVIGGGVGGITVAARLAKERQSWDILLLEKNDHLGGRLDQLCSQGFRFDTGPTLLLAPDIYRSSFAALDSSIEDWAPLRRVEPAYTVFLGDGTRLPLTSDMAAMRVQLEALEPGCFPQFLAYMQEARVNYERGFASRPFQSPDNSVWVSAPTSACARASPTSGRRISLPFRPASTGVRTALHSCAHCARGRQKSARV